MATLSEQLEQYLSNNKPQSSGGGMLQAGLGALGTFINGNRLSDMAGGNISSLQQQEDMLRQQQQGMPSLESMYGADSPYAKQLEQTLARKDAKAGRNSQYGPRAAQLQAMLADKASTYGAQQAQSMNAYNSARNATMNARNTQAQNQAQIQAQQLASLFNFADKSGLMQKMEKGLGGMFGGGNQESYTQQYGMEAPSWQTPDYSPSAGQPSSYGFDTNFSNPQDMYSIQTGNGPGMQIDSNSFWNPAPEVSSGGVGGWGGGSQYDWYE
jgi:hypothetical protein